MTNPRAHSCDSCHNRDCTNVGQEMTIVCSKYCDKQKYASSEWFDSTDNPPPKDETK